MKILNLQTAMSNWWTNILNLWTKISKWTRGSLVVFFLSLIALIYFFWIGAGIGHVDCVGVNIEGGPEIHMSENNIDLGGGTFKVVDQNINNSGTCEVHFSGTQFKWSGSIFSISLFSILLSLVFKSNEKNGG